MEQSFFGANKSMLDTSWTNSTRQNPSAPPPTPPSDPAPLLGSQHDYNIYPSMSMPMPTSQPPYPTTVSYPTAAPYPIAENSMPLPEVIQPPYPIGESFMPLPSSSLQAQPRPVGFVYDSNQPVFNQPTDKIYVNENEVQDNDQPCGYCHDKDRWLRWIFCLEGCSCLTYCLDSITNRLR